MLAVRSARRTAIATGTALLCQEDRGLAGGVAAADHDDIGPPH
jgi:hypothetical protein